MKNYKKALLALSVLATLPLMAATTEDLTIYVNTFDDEDGENSNACSLREALKAAALNKEYGGCSVGTTNSNLTDTIQLEAGTYSITKSLTPASQVIINGDSASNWDAKDSITNDYPEREALTTTIDGSNSFSLVDTTESSSSITLSNLKLADGKSTRGGAIIAGGSVALIRVEIDGATATDKGGAIYLAGVNSTVTMTDSVISNSIAPRGAVLGMSCIDNLDFTNRTITITNSSIVNNGNSSTKSVLEFCGQPTTEINASTVAKNTASTNSGSIIKFTGDSLTQNSSSILGASSKLSLISNTIVDNTAYSTFLYDSIGSKSLSFNLLAYNTGQSCRYLPGEIAEKATANVSLSYNGLMSKASSSSYCYLPYDTLEDKTTKDLSAISRSSVLTALQSASAYTAFMPMYFLNNPDTNPLVDLFDSNNAAISNCSSEDQRGVQRLADGTSILDSQNRNSCDIGSTELVKLTAADMSSINYSQVDTLAEFETQRDFYQALIDDDTTKAEFLTFYKFQRDKYESMIEDYQATERYRQVYFDVFANSFPNETQNVNGSRVIQHFDTGVYNVTTEVIGSSSNNLSLDTATASDMAEVKKKNTDLNLRCEWNTTLQQLVMYRTNGAVSGVGEDSYCKYTISLKADSSVKSTGVIQGTFENIVPIAKDDEYTLVWGTNQQVKIDPLANDSDDGDGKSDQENYPTGQTQFYVNPKSSISAPIKFGDLDSNLVIDAQYSELCPDDSDDTCYGGTIYIRPKNIFNKFNYLVDYQVFDADANISNTATITLTNTATTTDDTRDGSSGGGSFGWLSLFGLFGLAVYRRRK